MPRIMHTMPRVESQDRSKADKGELRGECAWRGDPEMGRRHETQKRGLTPPSPSARLEIQNMKDPYRQISLDGLAAANRIVVPTRAGCCAASSLYVPRLYPRGLRGWDALPLLSRPEAQTQRRSSITTHSMSMYPGALASGVHVSIVPADATNRSTK